MIELVGWEDGAFRDTEVLGNVCVSWFKDDFWVSDRLISVFVHVGVQRGEVIVIDFFIILGLVVEFDGISSSTAESISWVEWRDNVQFVNKVPHSWIGLLEFGSLTLPHLLHVVTTT